MNTNHPTAATLYAIPQDEMHAIIRAVEAQIWQLSHFCDQADIKPPDYSLLKKALQKLITTSGHCSLCKHYDPIGDHIGYCTMRSPINALVTPDYTCEDYTLRKEQK